MPLPGSLPMIVREVQAAGVVHAPTPDEAKKQWRNWLGQTARNINAELGRKVRCLYDQLEAVEKEDGVYYCTGRINFSMNPGGL